MLTCYITASEFLQFSDISEFANSSAIETALRAATHEIGETLTARGDDVTKLQPVEMFDGVTAFESVTRTADHVGNALEARGARFVVQTLSDTDGAIITLEGLVGASTWLPVSGVDGAAIAFTLTSAGTYTALVNARFTSYRLSVTGVTDSVTYRAYMTDTGPDRAIRSLATMMLLGPIADADTTVARMYDRAGDEYAGAMSGLSLLIQTGTDTDGDGDIDNVTGTTTARRFVRMYR